MWPGRVREFGSLIMTEKERSDGREPFSAVPDATINRQYANWAGQNLSDVCSH